MPYVKAIPMGTDVALTVLAAAIATVAAFGHECSAGTATGATVILTGRSG